MIKERRGYMAQISVIIIGLVVAFSFGMLILSICVASAREDELQEKLFKEYIEKISKEGEL